MTEPTSRTICRARMGGNTCNRPQGHPGPHGIDIGGGLILGPFDGSANPPGELCELACDCCSAPMLMNKKEKTFSCSACKQVHSFGAFGHTCLIVARLYPSKMNRKMALASLAYRASQATFRCRALLLLGEITQSEFDQDLIEIQKQVDAEKSRMPANLLDRLLGWVKK